LEGLLEIVGLEVMAEGRCQGWCTYGLEGENLLELIERTLHGRDRQTDSWIA